MHSGLSHNGVSHSRKGDVTETKGEENSVKLSEL